MIWSKVVRCFNRSRHRTETLGKPYESLSTMIMIHVEISSFGQHVADISRVKGAPSYQTGGTPACLLYTSDAADE